MAQNGTDSGPPKGSLSDSPHAQQIPESAYRARSLGGGASVPLDDPAFQPPIDQIGERTKGLVRLVYRDLPLVNTIVDWQVNQMRAAIRAHMWGMFEGTGQLVDAQLGDPRVQATLGSRISALFGREVRFKAANDSIAAGECLDAWVKAWPNLAAPAPMTEMSAYSIFMGWTPSQITWAAHDGIDYCPYLRPWHPRYTYYHWTLRQYIALSQDGQIPIVPGDGKWVLHAPYGTYRGWIRGAVRPVSEPWLMRHWGMRDFARYSEVHGLPTRKGICPASADQPQRDAFAAALSQLSSETTLLVSEGNDGTNRYDYELVEAKGVGWEAFPGLVDRCDMDIVLAIKFQNLTTEIKSGGSYAAAKTHENSDDKSIRYDNAAWRTTIHDQIARPFAFLNFGDPALAPVTDWDVTDPAELQHAADQFQKFGTAIEVLARGGIKFTDSAAVQKFAAERFGLKGLPDFTIGDPPAGAGAGGGMGGGFGK